MKVAVLGCGPAGLIAAHAAATAGAKVTVFSKKVKSKMFGAMYLHEPIPGIDPGDPLSIRVTKLGTREGYAANVYGSPMANVSWDKFEEGQTSGWSLGHTYDELWRLYSEAIVSKTIKVNQVKKIYKSFDLVVSSIPRHSICTNPAHEFKFLPIWVLHGKDRSSSDYDWMCYNGLPQGDTWYRYSRIQGYQSWEYSPTKVPPIIASSESLNGYKIDMGQKPLFTDCDCFSDILRVGRFGVWNKNVFTHHAYGATKDAVQQL